MNELTPDQSALLEMHLAPYLRQTDKRMAELSGDVVRVNARAHGRNFLELIEYEQNLNGLSYDDAVEKAASQHPDLYEQYRISATNPGKLVGPAN